MVQNSEVVTSVSTKLSHAKTAAVEAAAAAEAVVVIVVAAEAVTVVVTAGKPCVVPHFFKSFLRLFSTSESSLFHCSPRTREAVFSPSSRPVREERLSSHWLGSSTLDAFLVRAAFGGDL